MKKILLISLATSCVLAQIHKLDESVTTLDINSLDTTKQLKEYQNELPTKSVSIVTNQDILTSGGSGGVQSLLNNVPGITYSRSGGIGGQLTVRGMNSNNSRSIIAVDGVKVTGRSTLELNMIDPNSLDGIEVIRGAASSLYGSSAINGVINFKSRRYNGDTNAPFDLDAKIRALEFNSVNNGFGGRAEIIGGGDGWDILIGTHARKGNDFRTPDGIAQRSKYQSWGADYHIGYSYDDIRYYSMGKFQKINTYNAGGIHAKPGSSFGIIRNEDPMYEYYIRVGTEVWNLGFADKMDIYAYYRHYDTDLRIDRRSINGPWTHNKVYNTNQIGTNILFDSQIQNHLLSYGISTLTAYSPTQTKVVDLKTNKESTSSRPTSSTEIAAFIKDDWNIFNDLILSSSLRYDYNIVKIGSQKYTSETPEAAKFLDDNNIKTSDAITGSIGALYNLNDYFSIVGNVSRNYKSPGTNGLFPSATTEANHDLKAEIAYSYETGLRYSDAYNYGSLVYFRTDYTNMIQNQPISNGKVKPVNIGKALIQGLEYESHHKYNNFFIDLVGSYNYGQDKTADKPLAYIAPFYGLASLGYKFNWGDIKWSQRAYLGKNRIDNTQERKSRSYTMSDIYISTHLGYFDSEFKNMWITFGVENLFNTKGRNPSVAEDIKYSKTISNPLMEPGTNAFLKFAYNY